LKKHEAAFQTRFGRWLQYEYTGPTIAFELKRSLTSSLPFSEIREHQWTALKQAQTGLYYKIPDDSRSFKPFDGIFMRETEGYLVVAYGPRLTGFYMLDIRTVEELRRTGLSKGRAGLSLTEDLARQWGQYHELKGTSAGQRYRSGSSPSPAGTPEAGRF
jgi:hypothetical protein